MYISMAVAALDSQRLEETFQNLLQDSLPREDILSSCLFGD